MTAPTETPSLTTKQARGLAKRWVAAQRGAGSLAEVMDWKAWAPEREQLFAWVRANIGQLYGRTVLRKTQSMAAKLGITDEQADGLRRAAGWPS